MAEWLLLALASGGNHAQSKVFCPSVTLHSVAEVLLVCCKCEQLTQVCAAQPAWWSTLHTFRCIGSDLCCLSLAAQTAPHHSARLLSVRSSDLPSLQLEHRLFKTSSQPLNNLRHPGGLRKVKSHTIQIHHLHWVLKCDEGPSPIQSCCCLHSRLGSLLAALAHPPPFRPAFCFRVHLLPSHCQCHQPIPGRSAAAGCLLQVVPVQSPRASCVPAEDYIPTLLHIIVGVDTGCASGEVCPVFSVS